MENRVDRVFLYLLVIGSIAFGILSVVFKSDEIFGIPSDYWAGISCLSIILVIMGWVVVWFRERGE